MIKKLDLGPAHKEVFAAATPLGLIGLAIGCAALTPIAFGKGLDVAGLKTAAMYCLLFGAGGQLIAGLMELTNKNLYGGTLFTAFSFNWVMNWWALDALSGGTTPSSAIVLSVDVAFLVIFAVMTYGFGFYSKLLFLLLLDIDLMFVCRILKEVTHAAALNLPIAILTVLLALIALYIAFAMLINPTANRAIFKMPAAPMFRATPKATFDFSLRRAVFEALYDWWRDRAFETLEVDKLREKVGAKLEGRRLEPDLHYLAELGAVAVEGPSEGKPIRSVRLTAAGIDFYEQTILQKYAG